MITALILSGAGATGIGRVYALWRVHNRTNWLDDPGWVAGTSRFHVAALAVLLAVLPGVVGCQLDAGDPTSEASRPNVVLIMADDLGYGSLSSYGNKRYRTPHLDSLARSGLAFTDFHSNGTVCSPTRAALTTGRYQHRAGLADVVFAGFDQNRHHGLQPDEETTIAELLSRNGYATGLFGKWHLGYQKQYNPLHQGFDRFVGFASGNIDYHKRTTALTGGAVLLPWSGARSASGGNPPRTGSPDRYPLPRVDLAGRASMRTVIDREEGQYLGHPTSALLDDGRTIYCVYPKGHGNGALVMKRSDDGGRTWADRLPTPDNWATSHEVPTMYKTTDPDGDERLIMFSGAHPIRMTVSEDMGESWTPLRPIGDFGGIVAMSDLIEIGTGRYMAFFHDDGRFIDGGPRTMRGTPASAPTDTFTLYKTISEDGGLTWSAPAPVLETTQVHLCEAGLVRSPDGETLAMLLRENRRRQNSHVMFSDDEGRTWTEPRELPAVLTGDRHQAAYGPDGRLFVSFRDQTPDDYDSPTEGDWVGWVGTWSDLADARAGTPVGQYRVRLADNHRGADCAYPAIERLPDGTFVAITYGHWTPNAEPYILSVRFTLDRLDQLRDAGSTR